MRSENQIGKSLSLNILDEEEKGKLPPLIEDNDSVNDSDEEDGEFISDVLLFRLLNKVLALLVKLYLLRPSEFPLVLI